MTSILHTVDCCEKQKAIKTDREREEAFNVANAKRDPFFMQVTLVCGFCEQPWMYTASALGGEQLKKLDGPPGE